jgi:16S rRNA (cytidine1402-2'-O)-methyltransferase
MVSAQPTDRFFFEGFLPPKDGQRRTRIAELVNVPATLILYESGPRIGRTLAALAEGLGARPAAVCRELTKLHEEVRRGDLAALAHAYDGGAELRGEFTLVIAPPAQDASQPGAAEVDALLRRALQHASVKDAVSDVAAATGRPRREIYRRALTLSEDDGKEPEHGPA